MDQEQTWLEAARQGDSNAFGQLVETYQTPVYNLAYRMLGNRAEAEEAAQEAFLRAYTKLDSYDPQRKFSTWLLSITSHYCIDRLRRRRMDLISLENEMLPRRALTSPQPGPETRTLENERQTEVQALLENLPPDYRAAVVLFYWYDLSYQEIAKTTDSTVSAIKSRLFRARRMLAEQVQTSGASENVLALA